LGTLKQLKITPFKFYKMKESPLTIEMLLDQIIDLNIIQIAAIPMILLVVLEWVLTIIQKKIIT
jgi:hypothetical protein